MSREVVTDHESWPASERRRIASALRGIRTRWPQRRERFRLGLHTLASARTSYDATLGEYRTWANARLKSLIGGKGSALGAMLGALLIVLIRQSIRTLHFDQNYEWIVIGCAIIIAVVVDQWSTRAGARRLSIARETMRPAA